MKNRPGYTPADKYKRTDEDATYVERMAACGEPHADICVGLGVDMDTLKRHYADELLNGAVYKRHEAINAVFDAAAAGKGNMVNKLFELLDKGAMAARPQGSLAVQQQPAPVTRLGKKAALVVAASNPDATDPMGKLMTRRQGEGS